jgi:competence protein ComEA
MVYRSSFFRHILSGLGLVFALSAPMAGFAQTSHVAPVNINTASAETMADALQGVGLSRAEGIVNYRTTNGPFKNPADLAKVKGIGQSTVEKNLERIQVK